MTFTQIALLGGLAALVLAVGIYAIVRATRMRGLRRRYGAAAMPKGRGISWRSILPIALLLGALVSMVLAVGQFRLSKQATQATVILAIDDSDSMKATDVRPDRLEAAKAAAQAFLDKLPAGFRVGVVTFAGQAKVLVAPSTDRAQVAAAVAALGTSGGTVIGDGLTAALDTIEADRSQHGPGAAAVVLLTDGQDTGSKVPPYEAAARAHALGVRVFTVALGRSTGGTSGANTALLQQLATATGAKTFTAGSAGQLTDVYQTLGSQLQYDLAIGGHGTLYVVFAAVLALAAGILMVTLSRN
jgi:Ca-activated chloride channel family protein